MQIIYRHVTKPIGVVTGMAAVLLLICTVLCVAVDIRNAGRVYSAVCHKTRTWLPWTNSSAVYVDVITTATIVFDLFLQQCLHLKKKLASPVLPQPAFFHDQECWPSGHMSPTSMLTDPIQHVDCLLLFHCLMTTWTNTHLDYTHRHTHTHTHTHTHLLSHLCVVLDKRYVTQHAPW